LYKQVKYFFIIFRIII